MQHAAVVSLTSHLGKADSPVRAFFAERLPLTRPVVNEGARVLRGDHTTAPLAAAAGVDPGRAGTAVDYMVRFALAVKPCPARTSAHAGARMLGKRMSLSAMLAIDEALGFVEAVAAYRRVPTDKQWEDLARISLMLATFEIVFRSGLPPVFIADLNSTPEGWRGWTNIICVDTEVEDVAILGWAAAEDHRELRGRALICNPVFKQSRALGGADADLVTDQGLLIDLKSTSTTRVCSRTDLWQLCGYALADTDDTLGIKSVGLSALRWRTQTTWPLIGLLEQLAGQPVDLTTMRHDFASSVENAHRDSRRIRSEP